MANYTNELLRESYEKAIADLKKAKEDFVKATEKNNKIVQELAIEKSNVEKERKNNLMLLAEIAKNFLVNKSNSEQVRAVWDCISSLEQELDELSRRNAELAGQKYLLEEEISELKTANKYGDECYQELNKQTEILHHNIDVLFNDNEQLKEENQQLKNTVSYQQGAISAFKKKCFDEE